ncbi:MAG: hypothetical protein ACI8YQ_003111 [Polaribacter sp.]|jgi:hypothetical protein
MNIKLSNLFQFAILIMMFIFFTACGNGEQAIKHIPSTEHGKSAAYNSDYVCPMHCPNSGSDRAGICPGCGMNYMKLSEHAKNGHLH